MFTLRTNQKRPKLLNLWNKKKTKNSRRSWFNLPSRLRHPKSWESCSTRNKDLCLNPDSWETSSCQKSRTGRWLRSRVSANRRSYLLSMLYSDTSTLAMKSSLLLSVCWMMQLFSNWASLWSIYSCCLTQTLSQGSYLLQHLRLWESVKMKKCFKLTK